MAQTSNHWLRRPALWALVAYWLLLYGSTHWPQPPATILSHSDKLIHAVAYGILAALIGVNVALRTRLTWRHFALIVLGLAAFGAFDEITQIPVGRHCDAKDWLADMVGTTIGLTIVTIGVSLMARVNRGGQQI
jgi:VanZ family protein